MVAAPTQRKKEFGLPAFKSGSYLQGAPRTVLDLSRRFRPILFWNLLEGAQAGKAHRGGNMRYAVYHKKIAHLDKEIARLAGREARLKAGPWNLKLFPGYRAYAIERAIARRQQLALQRAHLEAEMFGSPALIWNTNPRAVFRAALPASPEAVASLIAAADAAHDMHG